MIADSSFPLFGICIKKHWSKGPELKIFLVLEERRLESHMLTRGLRLTELLPGKTNCHEY